MTVRHRIVTLLSAIIALLFVVSPTAGASPVSAFPYRHADFDFKVAWNVMPQPSGIAVDGLIKNVRYAYVDDVEMMVSLLPKDGPAVTEASFPIPQLISYGDSRPFEVVLPKTAVKDGDRLQFVLRYSVNEGNLAFGWMSSFLVDAKSGAVIKPAVTKQEEW